jgi:hypothetical protein
MDEVGVRLPVGPPKMKIFIICSKRFYERVPEVQIALEAKGHAITLPNSYDNPGAEDMMRSQSQAEHAKWKGDMFRHSAQVIGANDAVLVLNFEKNGIQNYIGGATFLEIYDAFRLGKKIFLYNSIPEGMLADELAGFSPVIIGGDLEKVL